jgi:hypothetical protein
MVKIKKQNKKSKEKILPKIKKFELNVVQKAIADFVTNINSVEFSIPLVLDTLSENLKRSDVDLKKYLGNIKSKSKKLKKEDIIDDFEKIKKIITKRINIETARDSIPKSLFILMVTHFDNLIRDLINAMYLTKPEILNESEKNISVCDLLQYKDIEDAKKKIIEREVDAILRESHAEHIQWLENKLSTSFRGDQELWKKFIEIMERRNLLIHSNGLATEQYINVCKKHNIQFKDKINVGKELKISSAYFLESSETIFEFGIKLSQVIWRRLDPDKIELADTILNGVAYELLVSNKNMLVKKILDFTTQPAFKPFSEENRLYFLINKAIALRDLGEKDEAKKIIRENDFSATRDLFKLAASVLLEDFSNASKIMLTLKERHNMKNYFTYWPLFNDFRKTNEFQSAYKKIFKKEFTVDKNPTEIKRGMINAS